VASEDDTPSRPAKRRIASSGRVTPKGGPVRNKRSENPGAHASTSSSRYTPPTAAALNMPSPVWVPVLMFTLLGLGMLVILLNYVSLLPGAVSNWYLLAGLGFILGGIVTATQYR
jgi:hypothetical protein